jgi:5-(carboxyamino)imidazole ribonucleotide synthase
LQLASGVRLCDIIWSKPGTGFKIRIPNLSGTMDTYPFPVARIGIIGGGQLGRMMVKAARRLGCHCVILDPSPGSPAGQVAGHQIIGDYHDPARLRELVESTDVTTFDIEDIDTETLIELEREGRCIQPSPGILSVIQDKLTQKQRLREARIHTADFLEVTGDFESAFSAFGYPLVQKARRGGYDGRGVTVLRSEEDFARHLPVPSYVERFVEAEKEIAVLVARGRNGEIRCYPVVEMIFRPGQRRPWRCARWRPSGGWASSVWRCS